MGADHRRGEKSSIIVFYRELDTADDADEGAGTRFVARASHVFNAAQVEGYSPAVTPQITATLDRHAAADAFIAATGAKISHGGTRAYYRPSKDEIVLPPSSAFVGTPTSTPAESYYATALHELAHWTGAEHRLARAFGTRFGDAAYAAEELVAELCAAFLTADLRITNAPRPDHAQYLASWLELMRADTRAVFTAASAASRAADFLHALQPRQESAAA
jgi:antirestriction protein ArdC